MHIIQQMPGTIAITELLEAMTEARNVWSVEHFILDNLQFLTDVNERYVNYLKIKQNSNGT